MAVDSFADFVVLVTFLLEGLAVLVKLQDKCYELIAALQIVAFQRIPMALVLPQSRTCPPFRLLNHWLETLLLLKGALQQVPLELLKSLAVVVHIGISSGFVHCGEDHEETDENEHHAGYQRKLLWMPFCLICSNRCCWHDQRSDGLLLGEEITPKI